MENLTPEYWNNRYKENNAGWDLNQVSPPLKAYFEQLKDKTVSILIPGCGKGYEGEFLFRNSFTNVHLVDFAEEPILEFQKRVGEFPKAHLHVEDFFQHQGRYDLIIEQTMFCAIDPSLRVAYAKKTSELLKDGGKLVGLFFNRSFEVSPPFGGNKEEYEGIFSNYFSNVQFDECYNSILPRQGNELFARMVK